MKELNKKNVSKYREVDIVYQPIVRKIIYGKKKYI